MENTEILLGLAGDVMIGRGVDSAIAQKGYLYPWGNVLELLRQTDINIVNLETALTNSNKRVEKTFNFKATPDKVQTLKEANITAVSLANNHILDFSEAGLIETISTLQAAGILYAGAGINKATAAQPAIIIKENFRLGLLSFTDNESRWKAGLGSGVNYIDIDDPNDQSRVINAALQLSAEVDFLIISLHWGPNMREEPPTSFIDFAHQLIEKGADIIFGHSAHIFQAIEVYNNKLILYDAGDFIDDYMVNLVLRNDLSFFFLAAVSKKKINQLQIHPVVISRGQVNKATGNNYQWSMKRMQALSRPFSTEITDDGKVFFNKTKL